ncbi:MAG TPA: 3-dehydroquinate synthase [Rickettsiales bacterium]|nr:3-dehydroquinate synthase [Rickettsiales bacterium]
MWLELGEKSYEIKIGAGEIDYLEQFLQEKNYSKVFVVTDENVAEKHLAELEEKIGDLDANALILAAGEATKNFENLEIICEEILSQNIDRKSLIIAFGGGVIGDLAGFAASILLRGIDFIQIPTTLLAAVDSSVGGKTAINSIAGKNLIGSFYQPKLVICDLNFLQSLPDREFLAGYAEILKYGLIQDEEFFHFLDQNLDKILARDTEILLEIIKKSCQYKAKIVSQDEKEQGLRALLNFGHTFGHVLEAELNFDGRINHGEAVGIGMLMASKMSQNMGFLSAEKYKIIKNHIIRVGLDIDLKTVNRSWNKENLHKSLYKDKKTQDNKLTFILLNEIGSAFIKKDVNLAEFSMVINEFI